MDVRLGAEASMKVSLLARAWGVDPEGVVLRLLEHFEGADAPAPAGPTSGLVAVHALYSGHKVPGEYDPESQSLVILSGPAQGRYKSPSGAATAVLQAYNPEVAPHRNGWSFWVVEATGARLQSLRRTRSTVDESEETEKNEHGD
ncbi:hypothetical protein [Streptomyces angustmyceticus]|uniref:hypothetical protein n=1 Tax=Streptomyces angustmyceticus TaxID=285578 RepID=UPI00344E2A6E